MERECIAPSRDMVDGRNIKCRVHRVDVFSGKLDNAHGGKANRGPLDAR